MITFIIWCVIFTSIWVTIAIVRDKKKWNKGNCPNCNKGIWLSFNEDESGIKEYKCTNCNTTFKESGFLFHKEQRHY